MLGPKWNFDIRKFYFIYVVYKTIVRYVYFLKMWYLTCLLFTNFFWICFRFVYLRKKDYEAFKMRMHLSVINTRRRKMCTIASGHRSKRPSSSSNWPHSILEWRTSGLVHGWTSTFHCDRAICELSPLSHRNCSLALLTVTTDSQFVRNGDSLLDAV